LHQCQLFRVCPWHRSLRSLCQFHSWLYVFDLHPFLSLCDAPFADSGHCAHLSYDFVLLCLCAPLQLLCHAHVSVCPLGCNRTRRCTWISVAPQPTLPRGCRHCRLTVAPIGFRSGLRRWGVGTARRQWPCRLPGAASATVGPLSGGAGTARGQWPPAAPSPLSASPAGSDGTDGGRPVFRHSVSSLCRLTVVPACLVSLFSLRCVRAASIQMCPMIVLQSFAVCCLRASLRYLLVV
jgi:hypothetical protein